MFSNLYATVASFTKEVNPHLAKRPLVFNRGLAKRGLTSLVKEAIGHWGIEEQPQDKMNKMNQSE